MPLAIGPAGTYRHSSARRLDSRTILAGSDPVEVEITDGPQAVDLKVGWTADPTTGAEVVGSIALTVHDTSCPAHDPIRVAPAIMGRINQMLDGTSVECVTDWRAKRTSLRIGPGRVLPLTNGSTCALSLTSSGWFPGTLSPTIPQRPAVSPTVAPTVVASGGFGDLTVPVAEVVETILPNDFTATWGAVRRLHLTGKSPLTLAISGPSGCGKTTGAVWLAAQEGLDATVWDCQGMVEPSDWFGTVALADGGTRFLPSDLLLALTLPGKRVVVLDEMNRASIRAANALLPILAGAAHVTNPITGQAVALNREVQVVCTMNRGSGFTGTDALDVAVANRLVWVEVGFLDATTEAGLLHKRTGIDKATAKVLASFAAEVRAKAADGSIDPVSTRQTLAAGHMIAMGLQPQAAITAAIVAAYSNEGGVRSPRSTVAVPAYGLRWPQDEAEAKADEEAEVLS